MGNTDRKLFVLDTNILLHEPLAIYSFQEHDVVVPMTVLEELDRIKDSKRDVARDARVAIRALEALFKDATPDEISEGIPISREKEDTGHIAILADYELQETVKAFADKAGDNRILNAVIYLQNKRAPREVVLITKDINMRLRAKGAAFALLKTIVLTNSSTMFNTSLKAFSKLKVTFGATLNKLKARTLQVTPSTRLTESLLSRLTSTNM